MDGVGTSIVGRPRRLSADRRARPTYTLTWEEPSNNAVGSHSGKVGGAESAHPAPPMTDNYAQVSTEARVTNLAPLPSVSASCTSSPRRIISAIELCARRSILPASLIFIDRS